MNEIGYTLGHTPGPWRACYSETNKFGGGNIRSDHHVDGTGALLLEAGPMFHHYKVNRHEEIANLHLAAAAPELLAALENTCVELKQLLESGATVNDWQSPVHPWDVVREMIAEIKHITAKAKGGKIC